MFLLLLLLLAAPASVAPTSVPLYRVFEIQLNNTNTSAVNKFRDIWLNATFVAPSGPNTEFWGFYDGGDVWRLRFLPNETGQWTFR